MEGRTKNAVSLQAGRNAGCLLHISPADYVQTVQCTACTTRIKSNAFATEPISTTAAALRAHSERLQQTVPQTVSERLQQTVPQTVGPWTADRHPQAGIQVECVPPVAAMLVVRRHDVVCEPQSKC